MSDPRHTYRTEDLFGRIQIAHHPFDDVASTRTAVSPFAYIPPRMPSHPTPPEVLRAETPRVQIVEVSTTPRTFAQQIADLLLRLAVWLSAR